MDRCCAAIRVDARKRELVCPQLGEPQRVCATVAIGDAAGIGLAAAGGVDTDGASIQEAARGAGQAAQQIDIGRGEFAGAAVTDAERGSRTNDDVRCGPVGGSAAVEQVLLGEKQRSGVDRGVSGQCAGAGQRLNSGSDLGQRDRARSVLKRAAECGRCVARAGCQRDGASGRTRYRSGAS